MMTILPYMVLSALFFSSFAFGLRFAFLSRERIIELYEYWRFSQAETLPGHRDSSHDESIILGVRAVGFLLLVVAVLVAWVTYLKLI